MATAASRLLRDLKQLSENPFDGISATPMGTDIMLWKAVICGPEGTPFENGTFGLTLEFNEEYPIKPPVVKFISKMFHPNISEDGDISFFQFQWAPGYTVSTLLVNIQLMLSAPNTNISCSANKLASQLFRENRQEYLKRARKSVEESWYVKNPLLVKLSEAGDLDGVKHLLQFGVDVNSLGRDDIKTRKLGWAKNDYRGTKTMTALMVALNNKQTKVATLLLKQEGIDVNIEDKDGTGWNALFLAAWHDESECLTMMLARPDMKMDSNGYTTLHAAVQGGAARCLQLLLNDKRTDPNQEYACGDDCGCYEGDTPLMLAVKYNHVDCVRVLLADPRVDLMTRDWSKKSDDEVAR